LNIETYNLDSKYLIFSGIGDPFSFKDILVENKFNVVREMIFPDHYDYNLDDLEKIQNIAKNENLKIITTEKDFMKIPKEFKKEINFLSIDLVIQDERKLIELLTK
jgi:tetraacyldisaccharide 4'-kinase